MIMVTAENQSYLLRNPGFVLNLRTSTHYGLVAATDLIEIEQELQNVLNQNRYLKKPFPHSSLQPKEIPAFSSKRENPSRRTAREIFLSQNGTNMTRRSIPYGAIVTVCQETYLSRGFCRQALQDLNYGFSAAQQTLLCNTIAVSQAPFSSSPETGALIGSGQSLPRLVGVSNSPDLFSTAISKRCAFYAYIHTISKSKDWLVKETSTSRQEKSSERHSGQEGGAP